MGDPVKIRPTPQGQNYAEFLLRANTVGLGKGAGSGLILDDGPSLGGAADGSSRVNQSCERLVRGDRGTSGWW